MSNFAGSLTTINAGDFSTTYTASSIENMIKTPKEENEKMLSEMFPEEFKKYKAKKAQEAIDAKAKNHEFSEIKNIDFQDCGDLTVICWEDGVKTFIKMHEDEVTQDPEKAIFAGIAKRYFGNSYSFMKKITPFVDKYERMFAIPALQDFVPLNRKIIDPLWEHHLGRYGLGENDGEKYEDDTFICKSYDWSDEGNNEYHFYHKPTGYKIQWYKYAMRGATANMSLSWEQIRDILADCENSYNKTKGNKVSVYVDKWWEK